MVQVNMGCGDRVQVNMSCGDILMGLRLYLLWRAPPLRLLGGHHRLLHVYGLARSFMAHTEMTLPYLIYTI
jgi:hypothetical protein